MLANQDETRRGLIFPERLEMPQHTTRMPRKAAMGQERVAAASGFEPLFLLVQRARR